MKIRITISAIFIIIFAAGMWLYLQPRNRALDVIPPGVTPEEHLQHHE